MAREFLEEDENSLVAAEGLASHWEDNRAGKNDRGAYLKKATQGASFLRRNSEGF